MKKSNTAYLSQAAMIAAIYVVLTYVFAPFSFGEIQVRIAEALTILPVFTPAAVPGLFIGCLIGNILGGAVLPDIIFGSIATLIGAFCTYQLRNHPPILAPLPPILANTVIVPFVLRFAYGAALPIPISNPHFKWGSNFNPSGVFLWFRQRRDFAVPFLLVAS
ncbi:MAG: QueT transporter family protein [Lachnospiraceae bacterium]